MQISVGIESESSLPCAFSTQVNAHAHAHAHAHIRSHNHAVTPISPRRRTRSPSYEPVHYLPASQPLARIRFPCTISRFQGLESGARYRTSSCISYRGEPQGHRRPLPLRKQIRRDRITSGICPVHGLGHRRRTCAETVGARQGAETWGPLNPVAKVSRSWTK